MCGIAGVIELENACEPSRERLQRMARALYHRGPDEGGVTIDGPAGLAHRRLSIIDLAAGKQPMADEGSGVSLVFNGEIYNFQELREELERAGHEFSTRSDTEVLLHLYLEHGVEAFAKLNAMLACAFWDPRHRRLVLARDRFGKKPVYWYKDDRRFLFASEIKSILAHGEVERRVDSEALHDYLSNNFIVGEKAIVAGIRRLPPGHFLVLENGRVDVRPYWRLRFDPDESLGNEDEILERLESLLLDAVKRRLVSDVPIGAFLSGGIDSSVVVALMAQVSSKTVKSFSIGFDESGYSELDDARVVAEHLGTDHREEVVKPAAMDILDDLVWHCDEPFGDSSAVPTFFVCQAARKHATVALSGDAGDEVFAGYRLYLEIPDYERMDRVPGFVKSAVVAPLVRALPFTAPGWNRLWALANRRSDAPITNLGIFPFIRDKLYSRDFLKESRAFDPYALANAIWAESSGLDPVSRFQHLDTLQYLPADILVKVDRTSMATSLEVRAPLLDYTVVEFMARVPVRFKLRDGVTKWILRKLCKKLLPESVLTKKKQGFAIPKGPWFRNELRGFAREILLDRRSLERGYFERRALERMLAHHVSGARDYSDWIWSLIVLEKWQRMFIDGEAFELREPRFAVRNEAVSVSGSGSG